MPLPVYLQPARSAGRYAHRKRQREIGEKMIKVRFRKVEKRADAEHWVTLHPNGKDNKGTPALINGAGQIIGGAGGKLTGHVIHPKSKSAGRPGTEEQHSPAIWLGPAKPQPEKPTEPEVEKPAMPAQEKPEESAAAPDPELRRLQANIDRAKELLEKSSGIPAFLRKPLEDDVKKHEAALEEYKKSKGGEVEAPKPEVKPQPEPPKAEEPKPEETPPPAPQPEKAPEPQPEPEKAPEPELTPSQKAEQEGDELLAKATTFEEAHAALKKFQEARHLSKSLTNEQHEKYEAAR
ncbi:MAG TPA: hypothetical protein VFM46_17420, partial [Pseudomonadales bacterium]|nr:hypothetical protein [Pseudomonadales bacterium]